MCTERRGENDFEKKSSGEATGIIIEWYIIQVKTFSPIIQILRSVDKSSMTCLSRLSIPRPAVPLIMGANVAFGS
jgi:hypothetical protein